MRHAALLIWAALLPCLTDPPALAGAWPRARGEGFASAALRLGWPQDIATMTSLQPATDYSTFYLEYGATEQLTLGFDVGHSVSGGGKTVIFAQWPLRQAETGAQVSAQLGAGVIAGRRVIRPGVAVGWGLTQGWLSLDGVAEAYPETGRTDIKLDITWGRNLSRDRKVILQVQTGQPDGTAPFARLAPSLVMPLRGALHMEAGATWGLTGDRSMGIKLGLWSGF